MPLEKIRNVINQTTSWNEPAYREGKAVQRYYV